MNGTLSIILQMSFIAACAIVGVIIGFLFCRFLSRLEEKSQTKNKEEND